MKTFTRTLKVNYARDIKHYNRRNNSKDSKRTSEQIAQSEKDKKDFYIKKWVSFRREAETKAQKDICDRMIRYING